MLPDMSMVIVHILELWLIITSSADVINLLDHIKRRSTIKTTVVLFESLNGMVACGFSGGEDRVAPATNIGQDEGSFVTNNFVVQGSSLMHLELLIFVKSHSTN